MHEWCVHFRLRTIFELTSEVWLLANKWNTNGLKAIDKYIYTYICTNMCFTLWLCIYTYLCVWRETQINICLLQMLESRSKYCVLGCSWWTVAMTLTTKTTETIKTTTAKRNKKQKLSNTWAKHAINKPKTTFILVAISEMIEWMHECLNMDMDVYSCP